ncbi:MAG TPA: group II intron reverse transcriptase/maturase [Candidatus Binatia bacterium]|jgi:RNA-directed DNA polymerase|nr:group II intron reverse transcriptase/maturase [Candidatus Binatia bacterium]
MSSIALQASSGLKIPTWHSIDWAGCYRRVRSLQRRLVQAVQRGAWRKVKRLSSLLVHSFAARAVAVKRVVENTGKKTPGVDGERWETPEQKAAAVARIGQWHRYHPRPLLRIAIPKKNGQQRLLSIPTLEDRARQAVYLQALQPLAETQGDPNSYGFRPKRRCADAIDQCFKVLRQKTSATWVLEGDIEGFFDHIAFSWIEDHIPMNKRILAKWLRCGFLDRGAWYPTTAGVPQGGIISPVISNLVLDGLEAIVQGSSWHRSVHNLNYVRWADDFLVTATSRHVLETVTLPRIAAFLAERGVRLSTEKTVITPLAQGFDFLGQTVRKPARPNGKPAKLQITPSKASFQALRDKVKALCKQARGHTPEQLIDTFTPVLRGWANYHRHSICGETFAKLDSFVWQRVYRWAKRRHSGKTGRWITDRYFPHRKGEPWRLTDPATGKQLLRVQEAVTPQRYLKIKGAANPFDLEWEAYFHHRDRELALRASSPFRAKILRQQDGLCPGCRQVIQVEEEVELHHRDGHHQNNQRGNLVLLHPNCHRQEHYAPEYTPASSRPSRGVGQA